MNNFALTPQLRLRQSLPTSADKHRLGTFEATRSNATALPHAKRARLRCLGLIKSAATPNQTNLYQAFFTSRPTGGN